MMWSRLWNRLTEPQPSPSPPPPTDEDETRNRFEAILQGGHPAAELHDEMLLEPAAVRFEDFSLHFGRKPILHAVKLPIPQGKISALVGPAGCGKTTLLRSIIRLHDSEPDVQVVGNVYFGEAAVYAPDVDLVGIRKRIGMVFQKPNLFPLSVYENIVYPLRVAGETNRQRLQERCEAALADTGLWDELKDLLDKPAMQLSASRRQRLCLARALAGRPELLLLDEPCAALDPVAAGRIEDLLHRLRGSQTVLLVTHNIRQASRASDFTALMYAGHVLECGPTGNIFTRPRLKETEDFVSGRFG